MNHNVSIELHNLNRTQKSESNQVLYLGVNFSFGAPIE